MRLRTYNSRRKRLSCKKKPTGVPFCYVVYSKRLALPMRDSYGFWTGEYEYEYTGEYEYEYIEKNRPFASYGEAIAHLTRVKLAIDEEDAYWNVLSPCKIVEGCYTKAGKEVITKVTRLNNECDRPSERHFGSGLPRDVIKQQKQAARQLAIRFGIPLSKALEITRGPGWSSGSTTSSSTTTTVGGGWYGYGQVPSGYRWYAPAAS